MKQNFWNKKNIVSLLIVIIMVSSVIGLMFGKDSSSTVKYNGYVLTAKDNQWYLKTDKGEAGFDFLPSEVEGISFSADVKTRILSTKMVWLTFNPENDTKYMDVVRLSFGEILGKHAGIYVADAALKNSTKYALPIVTCANATAFVPVLEFIRGNETKVYIKDNCIVAKAESGADFIKLRDTLLYRLFGVIE